MNDALQFDKELSYITGSVVYINGVPICPITINEIASMGYSKYLSALHYICSDIDGLVDNSEGKYNETHVYAFMLYLYLMQVKDKERKFPPDLITALQIICKTDNISYLKDKEAFKIDDGILNNDNFLDFQTIVKERNGLSQINEDIENPANAKAAALLAKKKALKKKVDKSKGQDGSGITLTDLVSITASGLHLPLRVVCDYDMYQFNDQFNRLRIFKDYDVNVQALLAGADSNSINLQHWMSKINSDESDE